MTWKRRLLVFASSLLLAVAPGAARAESPVRTVRLYAIECGHMDVLDMGVFADTGEYDGKSGPLAVTCYLIRHPMGTLLWDTGLSDKLAENKDGGGVRLCWSARVGVARQVEDLVQQHQAVRRRGRTGPLAVASREQRGQRIGRAPNR